VPALGTAESKDPYPIGIVIPTAAFANFFDPPLLRIGERGMEGPAGCEESGILFTVVALSLRCLAIETEEVRRAETHDFPALADLL